MSCAHARWAQQRLCRGDEWHAPADHTGRARISHREELRPHRLPSHVQTKELAHQSDTTGRADSIYHLPRRTSISTENGVEPVFRGAQEWSTTNLQEITSKKPSDQSLSLIRTENFTDIANQLFRLLQSSLSAYISAAHHEHNPIKHFLLFFWVNYCQFCQLKYVIH